jgi:PAS domain S-box-containing protein
MDHLLKDVLKMGLLKTQYQQEEMTQLLGIIQRFTELLPECARMYQICQWLVRIIIEETDFENCSVVLWNSEKERLSLCAAYGLEDLLGGGPYAQYHKDLSFARGEGIAGEVFSSHNPVFIEENAADNIPVKANAVVRPSSLACLPLLDLGVLNLSARKPYKFPVQKRRNWEFMSKIVGYLILESIREKSMSEAELLHANRPGDATPQPLKEGARGPQHAADLPEQAMDRTPQGICILNSEGNVLRINKSIERLQGGNGLEIIGRSPSVFFQDTQAFRNLFLRVRDSGQEEMTDVSLVNAKGRVYLADVYLSRLTSEQGAVTGYLLVINDMTKKKAFEDKMLQTEKLAALGTMAGGVAHDFNNLLMAVLGNIQLIMPQVDDEEIRRRLQNIEKAVHDGANTVRRLQRFTERDREHLASGIAVDVGEAITDVVELTRPRWKNAMEKHGRSIDFKTDYEPHCFAGMHASDLREILTNLVFNAIEAMPEGGTVKLSCKASEDWVILKVADTGIGMGQEVAAKIFDPFYTTKGVGNSGLGLSVSWSLVGRAGGEIQVKSEPGKGSIFILKLPKAQAPNRSLTPSNLKSQNGSYRLLVVDDDTEILGVMRDMLRLKGHKVVASQDGEEALGLIEKETFDLVLTDLGMPSISGWDIAARVKEKSPGTPVVLFTGWGAQFEEEDLSTRGVDLVLSKPLSWERLLGSIDKLLYKNQAA